MKSMAKVQLTSDRLKRYFEDVLPTPNSDDDELIKQRHERWTQLFTDGIGNSMPGVRGTVWAAYNGVVQWVDRESYTTRLKEPLKSIWFGRGRLLKERAFTLAEQLLTVSNN
jgi:hypothetical protein